MKKLISILFCLLLGIMACKKSTSTSNTATTPTTTTDTTPPVITLKGIQNDSISVQSTYTDAGAAAMDDKDGDISVYIVKTGSVNTSLTGTYAIEYNVRDAAGNSAIKKTRTVKVKNDADYFNGNYSGVCSYTIINNSVVSLIKTSPYYPLAAASNSINNWVTLTPYPVGSGKLIIALSGSSITPSLFGSGSGTISTSKTSFTIETSENDQFNPSYLKLCNCVFSKP